MTAPLSTAGLAGPQATASEQSRMELQAKLNGLGGLNGRNLPPEAKARKLREACEGFESIFIQKMWQEMRNAIPKTGILTGREERFWQDMYDQELSKSMTKAGGIGLADMMYDQLSRNLASASRSAAGAATGAAFTPTAAPLVSRAQADDMFEPAPPAPAASIYESEAPENGGVAVNSGTRLADAAPAARSAAAADNVQAGAQPPQPARPIETRPIQGQTTQSQPLAAARYSPAKNTAHTEPAHHKTADLNQAQGLLMAQQAMRDAGDKLGSRAVRPAKNRRQREEREERLAARREAEELQARQAAAAQPPQAGVTQNGLQPGSPEALKAAVAQARSGYQEQEPGQTAINLHNLVADMHARAAMQQTPASQAEQAEQNGPVIKRVRKTTNIPQNARRRRQVKSDSQAIRTLNVDNVGVNSRQGQGLAAYHAAQQEAARNVAASQVAQTGQPAAAAQAVSVPAQAVPPLTAASSAQTGAEAVGGGFAIPPLKAAERRS